jgi:hypothetical protein
MQGRDAAVNEPYTTHKAEQARLFDWLGGPRTLEVLTCPSQLLENLSVSNTYKVCNLWWSPACPSTRR